MELSKNFHLSEFVKSPTAKRNGIDNTPGEKEIANLEALCVNVLQPLRNEYEESITIAAGFRSHILNGFVGGATNSQHEKGEAADIDTVEDNDILFHYIKDALEFDQLIWEFGNNEKPDWVHVSYRATGNNRKQILRASRGGNNGVQYKIWQEVTA